MEIMTVLVVVLCLMALLTQYTIVSSQTCSLTTRDQLGPFHLSNAPWRETVCDESDPEFLNDQLIVSGHVKGRNCQGVESVVVEIWQADSSGEYDPPENQNYAAISWDYTHPSGTGDYKCRAQVRTDNTGAFTFRTVIPGHYTGRPQHLHYRVTSASTTSVHQMYFEWDTHGGKISSLTVPTVQVANNIKSAVFNFTIDVDGTYDLGVSSDDSDNNDNNNETDIPDGVEKDMTCYSCEICPDPFNPSHANVRIEQCPPHGCRIWQNIGSNAWSRGCLLTPECQPENAAYSATCCNDTNCNSQIGGGTILKGSLPLILLLAMIIQ